MRTVLALSLAAPAILLVGCSTSASSSIAGWQPPSDYEYSLSSTCGERTVLGQFRIRVRGGEVVDVAALDERAEIIVADDELRALVPSIQDLLDEAADARRQGADVVNVTVGEGGWPLAVDIDWNTSAVDDEACYRIADHVDQSS